MRTEAPSSGPWHNRERGFSMIELMCSVAISLLLLAGVVAMMSVSFVSYQNADRIAQLEERGWRALDILSKDIRTAGFRGCTGSPRFKGTSLNDADALSWNFLDSGIVGFQAQGEQWTPASPQGLLPSPVPGSDILVVRVPKRGVDPLRLRVDMGSPADELKVHIAQTGLRTDEIGLIYDCEASVYFQATAVLNGVIRHAAGSGNPTPGNSSDSLGYTFQAGAEIIPVQTVIYYVGHDLPELNNGRSLWRKVGANAPERLIDGIEQMQLQFGVDVTGDALIDDYVTAAAVPDWERVYSVSVAILVSSHDAVDPSAESFRLLDEIVRTQDNRMRRVFSATTSLRNRAS